MNYLAPVQVLDFGLVLKAVVSLGEGLKKIWLPPNHTPNMKMHLILIMCHHWMRNEAPKKDCF